jgi:hypothetical protein
MELNIGEYISDLVSVLNDVITYGSKRHEYEQLLKTVVNISKLISKSGHEGTIDVEVGTRVLKILTPLPELRCIDTDRKYNHIRIRCTSDGCYLELISITRGTEDRVTRITLDSITLERLIELACNVSNEDLKKIREMLQTLNNKLSKSIEVLKNMASIIKVLLA